MTTNDASVLRERASDCGVATVEMLSLAETLRGKTLFVERRLRRFLQELEIMVTLLDVMSNIFYETFLSKTYNLNVNVISKL